jgi:hypothetical protein
MVNRPRGVAGEEAEDSLVDAWGFSSFMTCDAAAISMRSAFGSSCCRRSVNRGRSAGLTRLLHGPLPDGSRSERVTVGSNSEMPAQAGGRKTGRG